MNSQDLKKLRDNIEKFSKHKQLEIFKLCRSKDIFFTENNNGVFINLTELPITKLQTIQTYVDYLNKQEEQIEKVEQEKKEMSKLLSSE